MGEGQSSSRDVVYPCVVSSVDAMPMLAVRCGVQRETRRCVAFESHCFRAAHVQLDGPCTCGRVPGT